eukprot:5999417-Pleurochrysis_carterae.AAC.1
MERKGADAHAPAATQLGVRAPLHAHECTCACIREYKAVACFSGLLWCFSSSASCSRSTKH